MNTTRTIGFALLVVVFLADGPVQAQMFGPRSLGEPLARQKGYSQFKTAGTLQWNERFIRSNRDITDFVGPDTRELRGFVGNIQGRSRGQVATMIQGLRRRVDRSTAINQPLDPSPSTGIYPPEVVLGFTPTATNRLQVAEVLTERLRSAPQIPASSRFAVSVVGRTATLRGEVPSAHDRDLAAALLSFEPGISEIDNQLSVNPQLDPTLVEPSSRPRRRWTVQSNAGESRTRSNQTGTSESGSNQSEPNRPERNETVPNLQNPPRNADGG
jgi:hypothetical protein